MLINVGLTRAIYLKSKSDVPLRVVKHAKEVKCSLISFSQACTVLCLLSKLAVCIASVAKTIPHDREIRLYPLSVPLSSRTNDINATVESKTGVPYTSRRQLSNVLPFQLKSALDPMLNIDGYQLTPSLNLMALLFLIWFITTPRNLLFIDLYKIWQISGCVL